MPGHIRARITAACFSWSRGDRRDRRLAGADRQIEAPVGASVSEAPTACAAALAKAEHPAPVPPARLVRLGAHDAMGVVVGRVGRQLPPAEVADRASVTTTRVMAGV